MLCRFFWFLLGYSGETTFVDAGCDEEPCNPDMWLFCEAEHYGICLEQLCIGE